MAMQNVFQEESISDLFNFTYVRAQQKKETLQKKHLPTPPALLRPNRMGCTYYDTSFSVARNQTYRYFTVHYIFSGCSFFSIDGQEHLLKKGDVFLIASGQAHRYCNADATGLGYLWVELETDGCADLPNWLRLQQAPVLDAACTAPVYDALVRMLRFVKQNGNEDPFAVSEHCYALLMRLCRAQSSLPCPRQLPQCITAALYYIGKYFAQTPSVKRVAQYAHVSESYLTKQFRQFVGTPPAHYVRMKKIEYALFLLRESTIPCEQIAEKCGFYDASHLSKMVARHVGASPAQIRAKE